MPPYEIKSSDVYLMKENGDADAIAIAKAYKGVVESGLKMMEGKS